MSRCFGNDKMIVHEGAFRSIADLNNWEREVRQRKQKEFNGSYVWNDDGKNKHLDDYI